MPKESSQNQIKINFKKIFNYAEDCIIYLSRIGKVLDVNKKAIKIFGGSKKEVIGKSFIKLGLFSVSDIPKLLKNFSSIIRGHKHKTEVQITNKKGKKIYLQCSANFFKNVEKNQAGIIAIARDITKQKQIQEKLKESEEKYRNLIEHSSQGIIIAQGLPPRPVFANQTMAKLLGYTIKEFLSLSPEKIVGLVHPRYQKIFFENYQNRLQGKSNPPNYQFQAIRKNGAPRWFEIFSNRITYKGQPSVQAAFIDITERKQIEENFRKINELNQKIFDNVPASILIMDKKGNIIKTNKLFKKMANSSKIGRHITNLTGIKGTALTAKYHQLLKNGKSFYQQNFLIKTKKPYYLNLSAVPIKGRNNEIEGGISIGQEITKLVSAQQKLTKTNKNLEETVKERTDELIKINKKLNQTLSLERRFLENISHELITPLTIIQGYLDLIFLKHQKNQELFDDLSNIRSGTQKITIIINELMDMINLENQRTPLNKKVIRFDQFVKETVKDVLTANDQKRKIKIIYQLEPVKVMADPGKIKKVIFNLINNGLKYADRNKKNNWIKIKLTQNKIRQSVETTLSVEDNGLGIEKKELPLIFNRFYRGKNGLNKNIEGTGLGLAICKQIVKAHGGNIAVKSKNKMGSKFTVNLPNVS